MWYPATVTLPADELVTLPQARAHVRVDDTDTSFDSELSQMIAAARDHVERYCGIRLGAQTLAAKCDEFCDFEYVPFAPVSSIASISYLDTDGATQTLASSVYELRADDLDVSIVRKYNQVWPAIQAGSRVTVTAVAGYTALPPAVLQAMLLLIGHWFLNRESVNVGNITTTLPHAVDDLLCNFRRGA